MKHLVPTGRTSWPFDRERKNKIRGTAAFITRGLRDAPDEPLKGCGAADRPLCATACSKERPARGTDDFLFSPLMAGVLLVESPQTPTTFRQHVLFDTVAKFPGYKTGVLLGYCSLTLLRTASSRPQRLGPGPGHCP